MDGCVQGTGRLLRHYRPDLQWRHAGRPPVGRGGRRHRVGVACHDVSAAQWPFRPWLRRGAYLGDRGGKRGHQRLPLQDPGVRNQRHHLRHRGRPGGAAKPIHQFRLRELQPVGVLPGAGAVRRPHAGRLVPGRRGADGDRRHAGALARSAAFRLWPDSAVRAVRHAGRAGGPVGQGAAQARPARGPGLRGGRSGLEAGASRRPRRARGRRVPRGEGPVQGLRRSRSDQQGVVRAGAGGRRVADRPQRRGQDHDAEPAVGPGGARCRQHPLQGPAAGGVVAQRNRGLGHRPHVPEPQAVRRPERAGKRDGGLLPRAEVELRVEPAGPARQPRGRAAHPPAGLRHLEVFRTRQVCR
ncbi:hypothetical protein FQZ97_695830 [compost metagenome]